MTSIKNVPATKKGQSRKKSMKMAKSSATKRLKPSEEYPEGRYVLYPACMCYGEITSKASCRIENEYRFYTCRSCEIVSSRIVNLGHETSKKVGTLGKSKLKPSDLVKANQMIHCTFPAALGCHKICDYCGGEGWVSTQLARWGNQTICIGCYANSEYITPDEEERADSCSESFCIKT